MTPTEREVLAALRRGPCHGYQIAAQADGAPLSFPTLYRTLASLQRDGLIECDGEWFRGNQRRIVYRLTEAGRTALNDEIARLTALLARLTDKDAA